MNRSNQQKNTKSDATMLQIIPPKQNGGQNAKSDEVREKFLYAYEETYGNISVSCKYAGINRLTFYRWMKCELPVNVEFQEKLELLKPVEKLLDLAEAALINRINSGDIRAIIYLLEKRGKLRGYGEKLPPTERQLVSRAVERIINTIERTKNTKPNFEPDIKRFVELASKDFGISGEAIEEELEIRFEQAKKI
jgi:hypothetical protein